MPITFGGNPTPSDVTRSTQPNTFTQNQTLEGTNNVAPNQTAASGSSLMTQDLADARFSRWENSHEITNFTGSFNGIVAGGSTDHRGGYTQMRAAAGGSYRSINTLYRGAFTDGIGWIASGRYLSRTIISQVGDIRSYASWFPVLGSPSTQWSGKGVGTVVSSSVMPYFMYRDEAWYAMKHSAVRGSTSVYPVRASNIVTIETNGNHNLNPGDYVVVAGVAPQSMQTWRSEVLSTPTSTSFTYANTGADETGTTILGDNMNIGKIEDLGSIATTSSSNLFTGVQMWDLRVAMSDAGAATFYANGAVVGTGTGFLVSARSNVSRVGYGVETLSTASGVTDFFITKHEHIINP